MLKRFILRSKRVINYFIFLFIFLFLFKADCRAQTSAFVNLVFPVRGSYEYGDNHGDPLTGVKLQEKWSSENNIPITWLLRDDVLFSSKYADYFKNSKSTDELGLFLEITPDLASAAEVSYPRGGVFWHDANKIFLSGYRPEDRKRLIDKAFLKFKENYGGYPKSVGAWHVDAFSAGYMNEKYGISGVLICADQYNTDNYQIWGGYWGVPFIPSKYNILTPAQTQKNKLDLVVFWWAARDPVLGYGGGAGRSTYSVQVNDYLKHGLGINYFGQLLDLYLKNSRNSFGQITIGLENDNNWTEIWDNYSLQLEEIKRRRDVGEVQVVTMAEFAGWYQDRLTLSPEHQIGDWQMSSDYRISTFEENGQRYIRDLRLYNETWPEANLLSANPWGKLSLNNPYKVDTLRFDQKIPVPEEITPDGLKKVFGEQKIPFQGNRKLIYLLYLLIVLGLVYFLKRKPVLVFLMVTGSVSLSLVMVKSGLVYPFGMGFWGPNGHDGIWHLALINQLSNFSLNNPVFSGTILANYHFGFDLLAAVIHKVTFIPVHTLYFQILPPVMAIALGWLVYRLVEKWTGSRLKAYWSVFFVYFGGSWGWVVSLWRTGRLGGESVFWANQAISTLINPPYILSLLIFLAGAIKFLDYLKKPTRPNLYLTAFLFGILFQVKVYAGIITLGSLMLLSLIEFFKGCGDGKTRKLTLGVLVVSLLVFLPFNLRAPSLLVFSPLWFPHTMLSYADRFGWIKLENARSAYFQSGNWIKWLLAEGLALVIFLFGNLGTRAIGLGELLRKEKGENDTIFNRFLLFGLLISFVLPLLFIQKGNPWNTIQFFYYTQFLTSIYAGIVVGRLWESQTKRVVVYLVSTILVVATSLTSVTTLKNDYLPGRPPARVSIEELEALWFLKSQPRGIVLTYPYNQDWRHLFSEPRPLYAYETTGYVSALGEKTSYLEDEMNLEIIGTRWPERKESAFRFFSTNNIEWANLFLKENKISYLYLVWGQKMNLGLGDINGEKIFENGEVVIIKIK